MQKNIDHYFLCIMISSKITKGFIMQPDITSAKKYFKTHFAENGMFSDYSAAYAVTNEDLRHSLRYIPENAENALVVAGSGDHPLFSALYGAKNTDAFDISYNAKLIMDIKTAALPILNHQEYCEMVMNLYKFDDKITSVENISKIIENLPTEEQQYIKDMQGYHLFAHGRSPNSYKPSPLPTETEYNKMRNIVRKPFNFIWSDIATLHAKLDKSYDFMHLSNIADYLSVPQKTAVITSLINHTRPGSVMCFQSLDPNIPVILRQHCEKYSNNAWALRCSTMWHDKSKDEIYLLKRER